MGWVFVQLLQTDIKLSNKMSSQNICKDIISCTSLVVDSGGTVVLVSQDGIQRPPLRFPKGGHLLQFLSCLENGLLPHGQLDPPLWSQRGKVSAAAFFFLWGCFLPENGTKILKQPYLINKSIKDISIWECMHCLAAVGAMQVNVLSVQPQREWLKWMDAFVKL